MFQTTQSIEMTYGDLLPYLGTAAHLADKGVPAVALLHLRGEQNARDTFGRSARILNGKYEVDEPDFLYEAETTLWSQANASLDSLLTGLAQAVRSGTESAGRTVLESLVENVMTKIFRSSAGADSEKFFSCAAWFPSAKETKGNSCYSVSSTELGFVFLAATSDEGIGMHVAHAIDDIFTGDPDEPGMWVTNGVGLFTHTAEQGVLCTECRRKKARAGFLDVRPNHLEVSLMTGDTELASGEFVFNVRSSVLFPDRAGYIPLPDPLGMVMLKHKKRGLDPAMADWFKKIQASGLRSICVAFGSFTENMDDYMPLWERLAEKAEEEGARLLLQISETDKNKAWPSDPHLSKFGYMPIFEVFGHCDTIVHTGGAATTVEGLYLGKPQVILYEKTGSDKKNNADQLGEFAGNVRACSMVIVGAPKASPKACRKLRMAEDMDDEELAVEVVAGAILEAHVFQNESAREKQRVTTEEMGDVTAGDSRSLRIIGAALHGLWTEAANQRRLLMPILIHSSSLISEQDFWGFASRVAGRTNAWVAAVGAESSYESYLDAPKPSNLEVFQSAASLRAFLDQHMPLKRFSKAAVVACEQPEPVEHLPWAMDFVFDQHCARPQGSHPWRQHTLDADVVHLHISIMTRVSHLVGSLQEQDNVLVFLSGSEASGLNLELAWFAYALQVNTGASVTLVGQAVKSKAWVASLTRRIKASVRMASQASSVLKTTAEKDNIDNLEQVFADTSGLLPWPDPQLGKSDGKWLSLQGAVVVACGAISPNLLMQVDVSGEDSGEATRFYSLREGCASLQPDGLDLVVKQLPAVSPLAEETHAAMAAESRVSSFMVAAKHYYDALSNEVLPY